jgi:hypothetical protein
MSIKIFKMSLLRLVLLALIPISGGTYASDSDELENVQVQIQLHAQDDEFSDWEVIDANQLKSESFGVNMILETGKALASGVRCLNFAQSAKTAIENVDFKQLPKQAVDLESADKVNEMAENADQAIKEVSKEFSTGAIAFGKAKARAMYYISDYIPALPVLPFFGHASEGEEKINTSEDEESIL